MSASASAVAHVFMRMRRIWCDHYQYVHDNKEVMMQAEAEVRSYYRVKTWVAKKATKPRDKDRMTDVDCHPGTSTGPQQSGSRRRFIREALRGAVMIRQPSARSKTCAKRSQAE